MNLESVQKNAGKSYVLTPNKRLARHLEKKLCSPKVAMKQKVWLGENIISMDTWLIDCWKKCSSPQILLASYQEKIIWQQIIREYMGQNSSLNIVEAAINFHRLINEYAIDVNDLDGTYGETLKFLSLYRVFINHCKKRKLITISEIPRLLGMYIEDLNISKITLVAFDEYTPALRMLLEAFKNGGSDIIFSDNYSQGEVEKSYIGFNTLEEEIRTIALWADSRKSESVGIIVPNLVALREKIIVAFDEFFENNRQAINISIGSKLDAIPIVRSALLLLSLSTSPSNEEIKNLILSPYINGFCLERSSRTMLHRHLDTHFNLPWTAIDNLLCLHKPHVALLKSMLNRAMSLILASQGKKLHPSGWKNLFIEILKIFGWPGDEKLSNLEFRAATAFYNTLEELSRNDAVAEPMFYEQAMQLLKAIVNSNTVQLRDEKDAAINILGILEGAGMDFDHLWIMGLDENNWPGSAKPNPFIPMGLQKRLNLPHSSPIREWEFCKNLLIRYGKGVKNIILSYVKQHDGREMLPSRLIADYPLLTIEQLNLPTVVSIAQKIYQSKNSESLYDYLALQLSPDEKLNTTSYLIETQSSCPFKACVEFRLAPPAKQQKILGVSKLNRGTIIHHALDFFWKKIGTQNHLLQLTELETRKLILEGISSAIRQLAIAEPLGKLERLSLIDLLSDWLNLEKRRENFQVLATEKQYTINLNGIPVNLRIDRIDKLADGRVLLIDYKSGKHQPTIFDWFSTRPVHPQLPLYSLALDKIDGLAIAQINHGALKFREITLKELAISMVKNNLPSAKEISWQSVSNHWRTILAQLAADFIAGKATIDPISQEICASCNFSTICRIVK